MQLPSSWLVALQFVLAAVLLLSSWPPGAAAELPAAIGLLCVAVALGISALAVNRLGNFNIRPELKSGARLITCGIYRWIRHPMYSALLLAMLATVLADPQPWRLAVWLALLGVLIAKAWREEHYLLQRFAEYASYRERTWRLLPWLW